jgi:hypothetical protein
MYFNKAKNCATALMLFSSLNSFAGSMGEVAKPKGHFLLQIGGYSAIQGKDQNIYVSENLLGARYTVKAHNQGSGLVGLGYLIDGSILFDKLPFLNKVPYINNIPFSFGIDTFFLGQTSVTGYILEEGLFNNLSYRYKLQHIPMYFVAKTVLNTNFDKIKLAVDGGIGPNFMSASRYFETPIDAFAIPNNAFTSRNNVEFSATVGASLRFNNISEQLPIECGYRFYYLGRGKFKINNNQVINPLTTGSNYANAFVCSVTL